MTTARRTTGGYPLPYVLSALCFIVALGGIVVLLVTDALHGYAMSTLHQRLAALPLMMIGASCIFAQLSRIKDRADLIKGIFLGVAFLLWGGELLIPPSFKSTIMDEGAVTIFVIDVSFMIWSRISLTDETDKNGNSSNTTALSHGR
jgi:hypothetical protein